MSSGVNENVDVKEVENDADENGNDNLTDELVEGEEKGAPLPLPGNQETQESVENGEVKTAGTETVSSDVVDQTAVEVEKEDKGLTVTEEIVEFHDVGSLETSGDVDAERVNGTEENVSTEVDANGTNDKYFNVEFRSKDVIDEGANDAENEDDVDEGAGANNTNVNAKENEEGLVNALEEEKIDNNDEVQEDKSGKALDDVATNMDESPNRHIEEELEEPKLDCEHETVLDTPNKSFLDGYESGTEEEQAEFANEVKNFYRENNIEYKAPKFYKEDLNLLKLWRAVIKLGGYDQVTSSKLWRQVGESFRPPKTCTTVSWTFRIFYEKALLEYEKNKMRNGELPFSDDSLVEPVRVENQVPGSQALGSGRARRDAAARAMQGWHSQRLLGNGEVSQPIIKDKNLNSAVKGDKQQKTNGLLKRKKPSSVERGVNVPPIKSMRMDSMVVDVGPPADWVKINVQKTSDCYEIYALVPGLLREEVHVQSDPAGRLIIYGEPQQLDNPWGVTAFKKVVNLPSRIDPHQTSAVVTLHGQLFVRVPFEQLDS